MKSYTNCRFCDIINGRYRYIGIDEPIAENEDFVVIASIGTIVAGWTLVVPKDHQCSMKLLYQKTTLKNIANQVIPNLINAYGPLIAFEHGANKNGSPTGCGIDHAHLHFVPLKKSLIPELNASSFNWIKSSSSKISSRVSGKEYLFYTELSNETKWLDPVGYLHILEHPVSQFFRLLIGKQIGKAELTDYRAFPHLEIAKQTRNTLSEFAAYH